MRKNYPTEWGQCRVCGNNFALKIPKGGDGFILVIRLHTRKKYEGKLFREQCPGSNCEPRDILTKVGY